MNMAKEKQGIGAQGEHGDPRAIGRWARIYARNRSLPIVIGLLMFALLSFAVGTVSYVGILAFAGGHMLMFAFSMVALIVVVGFVIYVSVPRWGGRRLEIFANSLYDKEGSVAISNDRSRARKAAGQVAVVALVVCVVLSVILEARGYYPQKYLQPVSALIVIPFLVTLGILGRLPVGGGWPMLLWPVLYGLHAVLIVAGAPILFSGKWEGLNMLLPTAGYGLLAALATHVYSRFALRKLKRLSRMELPAGDGHGGVTQP